jgi:hypothetical protein
MTLMTCEEGEKYYAFGITDAAAAIHEWAVCGDPMGLPLNEVFEFHDFLKLRLASWSWGPERSAYDQAMHALATAALAESEAKWERLAKCVAAEEAR